MENKRKIQVGILAVLSCLMLSGCATGTSPKVYYNMNNWYVRDNAVPQYARKFDVFYVHPQAFRGEVLAVEDQDFVVRNTVEKFGRQARIFAPVCRNSADCKAAFRWYLEQYHRNEDRPFVFLSGGEGARMLEPLVEDARKSGLVSTKFRFEETEGDFVTSDLVDEIYEEVKKYFIDLDWRKQRFVQ